MSFGIKLVQGGVTIAAGATVHPAPVTVDPDVLCYLSFTGTTGSYAWSMTGPVGSHAVISSATSASPTFLPDLTAWAGSVTLIDDAANVYILDIVTPSIAPTAPSNTVLYATSYGVKADGREITDGVLSAGSNVFTSATAAFTAADVGKLIVLRTPVSALPTGTVSMTIGTGIVTGSGTAFTTEIPNSGGVPSNGGAIYIDGEYFAILSINSNVQIFTRTLAASTHTNKTLYRDSQIATTIASVSSATTCTLTVASSAIKVSGTSVLATIASDDTDAIDAANTAAFADDLPEIIYPSGIMGMTDNLLYTSQSSLTIRGQGWDKTVFRDMRTASDATLVGLKYGLLSFSLCNNINLRGVSFDSGVPVLGMAPDIQGAKKAVFIRDSPNCSIIDCGSHGYGARDEHFYVDGTTGTNLSTNLRIEDNICELTNGNTINPGNVGHGLSVRRNKANSGYSALQVTCLSGVVDGNQWEGNAGFTVGGNGAEPVIIALIGGSVILYSNNTIRGSDTHGFSIGLLSVQGALSDSACCVVIKDNIYYGNAGYFYNSNSAIVRLFNVPGTVVIDGETFDENTASQTGGTFIEIDGASTSFVGVSRCMMRGRAGSNMTRGVVVAAGVPNGTVFDGGGNKFGESVTTTWDIGSVGVIGALNMGAAPINVVFTNYAGTPEGNVTASPGAFCADTTNGEHYVKKTGTSTNTGWKLITHA